MAFDAEIIGTWGCLPEYYPKVLEMVQDGRVQIEPFLETKPMSQIEQVFEQQHATACSTSARSWSPTFRPGGRGYNRFDPLQLSRILGGKHVS